MRRCSTCIMPDSARGIRLDARGKCQLCNSYSEFKPKGEAQLRAVIASSPGTNREYNCVVPVSGGRDSAYALYYAKKTLGLEPLAVHNDNDFETDIARQNLEAMATSLNVPLIVTGPKNKLSLRVVAEKFTMNAPFGPGLVASQACEVCKYGFESGAYETARKMGISLVFWGDSKEESSTPYLSLAHSRTPSKWERLVNRGFLNLIAYKRYFKKLKKECGSDKPAGVVEVHLYDYIRWDQRVIVDTIQRELGWRAPETDHRTWRVDCTLVPVVNYLTEKAYGVSKIEIGYSNMVRAGKMDRNEALMSVEAIKAGTDEAQIKQFLARTGIKRWAVEKMMESALR